MINAIAHAAQHAHAHNEGPAGVVALVVSVALAVLLARWVRS